MKKALAALLLCAASCLAATFPYPLARTDQNVTQFPSPLPSWGGAIGAGNKWCNPAFNNLCIIRITDAKNQANGSGNTTADTGEVQLATRDARHIIIRTNGSSLAVGFNPKRETVTGTLIKFPFIVIPSSVNSQLLYSLDHTRIHKLTMNLGWTSYTDKVIFDYASAGCLGVGYKNIWHGVFTIASSKGVSQFKTAFSDTGAQGSGDKSVSWSPATNGPTSCDVWNTVTGEAFHNGKALGLVDTPDRFYMHSGGSGPNVLWSDNGATLHQPNGKDGCLTAKNCATHYFWQIGTTHVAICGVAGNLPPYCDGHLAQLQVGVLSDQRYKLHDWANPNTPLTSYGQLGNGTGDTHQSTTGGTDIGGFPLFIFSQQKPNVYPFTGWGADEIMVMAMDGSKVVGRLGHNLNTGTSKYFVCHDGIGTAFQPLNGGPPPFALFTSDMGGAGQLGYEADGVTPRCDVFAIETMKP